ncbi:MAG: hypothetical protein M1839_001241 [Geoglossum umbratile]|nr:MAG: hypothetical protein M1839_001241 [Geoglossum umbratile]
MTLKTRIFRSLFHSARRSADVPGQSNSTVGRSAPSAENWSKSLVTADELARYLGDDIDLFDVNSVNEPKSERLRQLKAVGEGWTNSRADVRVGEWKCSHATAALIHLASHASNAIRPSPSQSHPLPPDSSDFRRIAQIGPSTFGTVKATSLYQTSIRLGPGDEEETVIVVTVRANAGLMDWVVNGNFELAQVEEGIIVRSTLPFPLPYAEDTATFGSPIGSSRPTQLEAHGGFLHAARESLGDVVKALADAITSSRATRVLFAGHSAGGSVVNLLFAHFVTCAQRYAFLGPSLGTAQPISLDCVTFGAPPILSRNITTDLKSCLAARSVHESTFLALIIEGDPVPRLDLPFAMFLGDALREVRPAFTTVGRQPQEQSPNIPPLTAHTMGNLVMFREMKPEGDRRDIRMYAIREEVLATAAFVNLCVHYMFVHMEVVGLASCLRLHTGTVGGPSGPSRQALIRPN